MFPDPDPPRLRRLAPWVFVLGALMLVVSVAVLFTLRSASSPPFSGRPQPGQPEMAPPPGPPDSTSEPALRPPTHDSSDFQAARPPTAAVAPPPAAGDSGLGTGGARQAPYVTIPVFYGTDRRPTGSLEPSDYYDSDWKDALELGVATVSIPPTHRFGEMEHPRWLHLEFTEDPTKHIVLLSVTQVGLDNWVAQFREHLAATSGQEALVFVHGYNVTFEDAARRTAQMAYDLGLRGVPTMFSWPSKAGKAGYFADEATASVAGPHFRTFLVILANLTGAKRIHVLAHSMGSRVLGYAVRDIAAAHQDVRLSQIILCAPDIDAREFRTVIAPAFLATADHTTMYVSTDDRALKMSKAIHDYERAGQTTPQLVLVNGLDLVDASSLHTDFLGHSYCAETRGVLNDLFQVIVRHAAPGERNLRHLTTAEHLSYWGIP